MISSCVNFVGVDLNTASVPLLRHVSGLNQLTARRIVDYRKDKGPFTGREQLMQVEGIGPATYTQAAGFLKIPDGGHPLDRTWIHPESYEVATRLLEKLGLRARRRPRQGEAPRAPAASSPRPTSPRWPRSWESASSRSTTSSRPWAGPSATRATTCPSRSSRRASSSSKTWPPAWS